MGQPPPSPLAVLAGGSDTWTCSFVDLVSDDELFFRFTAKPDDVLEITILPRSVKGPVFRRLERCAVRYGGRIAHPTAERRAEIGALVMGLSSAIDARMLDSSGATLAAALGRVPISARVPFTPATLRGLLGPAMAEGREILDGWSLAEVSPYVPLSPPGLDEARALMLDFRRRGDRRRLLIRVARREEHAAGFAQTTHFTLAHLSLAGDEPPGASTLRSLVGLLLQVSDHRGLTVDFPLARDDFELTPALPPAPTAPVSRPEDLHLVIDSECHQDCEFCSLREILPPSDGGAVALAKLCTQLRAASARGSRSLKLTGYDPLTFSGLFELLAEARALGFERVEILSPSTRLADPDFAERLLDALPAQRRIYIPLYGCDPAIHDRIVGLPGAHARVMAAIDVLLGRLGRDNLTLTTVLTTTNLAELGPLVAFARERRVTLLASMPYPNYEPQTERYFATLPRQTEVADAWAIARRGSERPWRIAGLAPCVAFRRMKGEGVPVRRWLELGDERPSLPGTNGDDTAVGGKKGDLSLKVFSARIPCPHAERCALALACPGEILHTYAQRYGMDELAPVSLRELLEGA